MKYLLSISIGPVQDFIATARRSRICGSVRGLVGRH
jgi:hypothetical protein